MNYFLLSPSVRFAFPASDRVIFFFLQQLLRFVAQSFCLGAFTYRTNDIYARFLSYVLPFFCHSVWRVGIRLKKEGLMMLVAWFAC